MAGFLVLATVHFDDQFGLGRVEINDIVSYRFLAIELNLIDLFATQFRPEALFAVCLVGTQITGWLFEV